ncbi:hypothetical protein DL93DRAFT_2230805 [Clavulina sp. PMI_390]|nr:hypothetical protein DL93DRAFT_2230805 [Clavulina sp. PMI_390]
MRPSHTFHPEQPPGVTPEDEFRNTLRRHGHSVNHIPITFPALEIRSSILSYQVSPEFWLLLHLLPNLSTLKLPKTSHMMLSLALAALGMTTVGRPAALHQVRTIKLIQSSRGTARDFVALFGLPLLRDLSVEGIVDLGPDWCWESFLEAQLWKHGESTVENLRFNRCDFDPSLLATLIIAPLALQAHASTITSIDISIATGLYHATTTTILGTLGSLREFSHAKRIAAPRTSTPWACIKSPSVVNLPRSSQPSSPTFPDYPRNTAPQAMETALFMDGTTCPEQWPSEKRDLPALEIFLLRRMGGDDWAREAGRYIISAFEKAGIDVITYFGEGEGDN